MIQGLYQGHFKFKISWEEMAAHTGYSTGTPASVGGRGAHPLVPGRATFEQPAQKMWHAVKASPRLATSAGRVSVCKSV